MITLDRDYIALKPYLEAECTRRGVTFAFEELNPGGWGDLMFVGWNGVHNVEIKEFGESFSDMDHLIEQIKAQAVVSHHLWLFRYGNARPAGDGNSYSLKLESARETWAAKNGYDSGWQENYTRRFHRVNYWGQSKILWRFREVGVQVIEVRDLPELAFELCTLYECSQNEGSTFSRLIVEKIRISETDPARAAFMKTLMGIQGAGIGEEVADAIADYVGRVGISMKLGALIDIWGDEMEQRLAAQPLRSSLKEGGRKRTIGPAAVAKLKTALGM